MNNVRNFYNTLSSRVVELWQTAEDLSTEMRRNIHIVTNILDCTEVLTIKKMAPFSFFSIHQSNSHWIRPPIRVRSLYYSETSMIID